MIGFGKEKEAFDWLQKNAPDLELVSTILPKMVLYGRGQAIPTPDHSADTGPVIALGQKAAWFCQTGHVVNMIEGGGLWGYQGLRVLCSLLEEASRRVLDYKQIIPRKGMGWPSLCDVPAGKDKE